MSTRVIITTYNQHIRLLPPEPWLLLAAIKSTQVEGADSVMKSTGLEAFSVDSALAGFVLFEQVEGDAVENGEVLGCVACAFAVVVFAKTDIEHPVQFVLDAPVLTNGAVQTRRIRFETGDVVAGFGLGFTRGLVIALRLDTHYPL